jgi:hypothetical protein
MRRLEPSPERLDTASTENAAEAPGELAHDGELR